MNPYNDKSPGQDTRVEEFPLGIPLPVSTCSGRPRFGDQYVSNGLCSEDTALEIDLKHDATLVLVDGVHVARPHLQLDYIISLFRES